jgi:hypothetical protein
MQTRAHICTQILMEMVYFAHRPGTAHRQPRLPSLILLCNFEKEREKSAGTVGVGKRVFQSTCINRRVDRQAQLLVRNNSTVYIICKLMAHC